MKGFARSQPIGCVRKSCFEVNHVRLLAREALVLALGAAAVGWVIAAQIARQRRRIGGSKT